MVDVRVAAPPERRIERLPAVRDVPAEPRRGADEHAGGCEPGVAGDGRAPPQEPRERRQGDEGDLRRGPPAETDGEPERGRVGGGVALAQAQRQEHDREAEHERGAVEAVSSRRLPDEVGGPDPEERGAQPRAFLADGSPADAPDEQRREREENDRYEPDRDRARARQREDGRRQQRLLRPAVVLSPEEHWELAVTGVPRHQTPDPFVCVERTERRGEHPHSETDSGDDRSDDEPPDRHQAHERRAHYAAFRASALAASETTSVARRATSTRSRASTTQPIAPSPVTSP